MTKLAKDQKILILRDDYEALKFASLALDGKKIGVGSDWAGNSPDLCPQCVHGWACYADPEGGISNRLDAAGLYRSVNDDTVPTLVPYDPTKHYYSFCGTENDTRELYKAELTFDEYAEKFNFVIVEHEPLPDGTDTYHEIGLLRKKIEAAVMEQAKADYEERIASRANAG